MLNLFPSACKLLNCLTLLSFYDCSLILLCAHGCTLMLNLFPSVCKLLNCLTLLIDIDMTVLLPCYVPMDVH